MSGDELFDWQSNRLPELRSLPTDRVAPAFLVSSLTGKLPREVPGGFLRQIVYLAEKMRRDYTLAYEEWNKVVTTSRVEGALPLMFHVSGHLEDAVVALDRLLAVVERLAELEDIEVEICCRKRVRRIRNQITHADRHLLNRGSAWSGPATFAIDGGQVRIGLAEISLVDLEECVARGYQSAASALEKATD